MRCNSVAGPAVTVRRALRPSHSTRGHRCSGQSAEDENTLLGGTHGLRMRASGIGRRHSSAVSACERTSPSVRRARRAAAAGTTLFHSNHAAHAHGLCTAAPLLGRRQLHLHQLSCCTPAPLQRQLLNNALYRTAAAAAAASRRPPRPSSRLVPPAQAPARA